MGSIQSRLCSWGLMEHPSALSVVVHSKWSTPNIQAGLRPWLIILSATDAVALQADSDGLQHWNSAARLGALINVPVPHCPNQPRLQSLGPMNMLHFTAKESQHLLN